MPELNNPRVIVAMPAYNEERYIGSLVLKAEKYADKVIVVDDGSADQTAEIARLAGATVISHPQNKGKGAAIQRIINEVKKTDVDILVLLDADSQHNPDEIPRLIKPILDGYDFVIGSRELVQNSIPLYRRIGQKVLLHFTRSLTSERITDSESGFRAFSRKALKVLTLKQNGFAIETEMIAVAEEKKLKVTEVPISVIYTKDGSTLNPVSHGLGVITQILVMISERKPLFFFGLAGGISVIIGIVLCIRVLEAYLAGSLMPVVTGILAVLFLLIGTFSLFTGIILHTIAKKRKDWYLTPS